jgi:hypothetical protein
MNRRRALAVVGSAGMISLSGCAGITDYLGDDSLTESETRLLTKYEIGYDHYEDGMGDLRSGMETYEQDDHEAAGSSFLSAIDSFRFAKEDFRRIEAETVSEIGSDDVRGMVLSAIDMSDDLQERADELSTAAAELVESGESADNRISEARRELRNGGFDIPSPEDIEAEF